MLFFLVCLIQQIRERRFWDFTVGKVLVKISFKGKLNKNLNKVALVLPREIVHIALVCYVPGMVFGSTFFSPSYLSSLG